MHEGTRPWRVVVVGGGISGLAAAWRLSHPLSRSPDHDGRPSAVEVVVLESAGRLGGKLTVAQVGGRRVDVGAESVLARRPEAVALFAEAGLAGEIVHPVTAQARVLSRGSLHPLPRATVMGVPTSAQGLQGLLTAEEIRRVEAEPQVPGKRRTDDDDVDVASWVAARMGRAVVDRLVEPLLGGVYAGRADRLSLQATVPALWESARSARPLLAVRHRSTKPRPEPDQIPQPVFAGLRGGIGELPARLAAGLRDENVEVRTGVTVRGLQRTPTGWRLETGPAPAPAFVEADAVILAVPPAAAARLLAAEVPLAAAELAEMTSAGVAVVATALLPADLEGVTGSGLLVPPVEGMAIKAATFSSSKWAWVSGPADPVVVRLSLGRAGDEVTLQRTDAELTRIALDDLSQILGRRLHPVDSLVQRWGGGLPQYEVGHLQRIARLRAAVAAAGGLAVCGAALDGVGVAACIAAADRAVDDLGAGLGAGLGPGGGRIAV